MGDAVVAVGSSRSVTRSLGHRCAASEVSFPTAQQLAFQRHILTVDESHHPFVVTFAGDRAGTQCFVQQTNSLSV